MEKPQTQPRLIFFFSSRSGRCRRVEAFLAQVLQRRGNHETFKLYRVDVDAEPGLTSRLRIGDVPTLAVIEGKQLTARLERPRGCREIERFLAPWLQ